MTSPCDQLPEIIAWFKLMQCDASSYYGEDKIRWLIEEVIRLRKDAVVHDILVGPSDQPATLPFHETRITDTGPEWYVRTVPRARTRMGYIGVAHKSKQIAIGIFNAAVDAAMKAAKKAYEEELKILENTPCD